MKELSNKKLGRIAGLIYLGVVITGIFSLMYVPSKLIVDGNPLQTVLYKLFKPVNENYAALMVI